MRMRRSIFLSVTHEAPASRMAAFVAWPGAGSDVSGDR